MGPFGESSRSDGAPFGSPYLARGLPVGGKTVHALDLEPRGAGSRMALTDRQNLDTIDDGPDHGSPLVKVQAVPSGGKLS